MVYLIHSEAPPPSVGRFTHLRGGLEAIKPNPLLASPTWLGNRPARGSTCVEGFRSRPASGACPQGSGAAGRAAETPDARQGWTPVRQARVRDGLGGFLWCWLTVSNSVDKKPGVPEYTVTGVMGRWELGAIRHRGQARSDTPSVTVTI